MRHRFAFDLSRMFVGAAGATPRGIDRIDMGYAARLFADSGAGHVGLVPSAGHMGVLTAREAGGLAGAVERHWREGRPPADDALLAWVRRRLNGEQSAPPPPQAAGAESRAGTAARYAGLVWRLKASPFRPAARAVPQGAVYINVGQVLLGWPWFFDWLERRPDVRPVFMMHDLIPVLHPEYSGPVLSRHHGRALRTAARRAAAMIATSQASADEIRDALAAEGRRDMPIHVVPLPVSDSLLENRDGPALTASEPYFVAVGILDQRKNHLLLLQVWRDLVRRGGPVPKLVVIGSRGLRVGGLLDLIERSPGLSRHVIVVTGLPTPAMREVIRGARALLMPSFTEGFGLPVVEGLALGTPVIASDIAAHREVGGTLAAYLDPLDGIGWRDAVLHRASEDAAAVEARRGALAAYRPQSWTSYFADVMPFLEGL